MLFLHRGASTSIAGNRAASNSCDEFQLHDNDDDYESLEKFGSVDVVWKSFRNLKRDSQGRAASLTGSPAIRLCHITRGSLISHGVAWWSKHRLSQITASPAVHS